MAEQFGLVTTKRAGVRNHGAAGFGKARFQLGSDGGVERGENHLRRAFRCGWGYLHFGYRRGNGRLQPPARCFGIHLAFGAVRSGQPRHFKPGMALEHLNESLSDDAGGAKNANRNFASHNGSWNFITIGAYHRPLEGCEPGSLQYDSARVDRDLKGFSGRNCARNFFTAAGSVGILESRPLSPGERKRDQRKCRAVSATWQSRENLCRACKTLT